MNNTHLNTTMLQHHTVNKSLLASVLFFFLNLCVGLPLMVSAQTNFSYDQQLQIELNKIISSQNLNLNINHDLENFEISNKDKLKNNNIYFKIFNTYHNKSKQESYMGLSLATGFTINELEDMIEKNYIYPVLTDNLNESQQRFNDVLTLYKQELSFFQTIANLKIDAIISEIFVDANVSNSGLDLIHDLNLIEKKLFLNSNSSTIHNTPTERNNLWSNFNSKPSISNFSTFLGATNSLQGNTSGSGFLDPQNPIANPIDLNLNPNFQFPKIQYGLVCPTDPKLYQELEIFNNANPNQTPNSNSSNNNPNTQINPTQSTSNTSNTQSPSTTTGTTLLSNSFDSSFFESSSKCPQDQLFCLLQETKTNQLSIKYPTNTTPNSPDCVACVINRINKSLQTLLDNGVLPKKITGNFAEPPLCKQASFGAFALNINIFSKPVPLPAPSSNDIQNTSLFNLERTQNSQNSLSANPNFSLSQEYRPKLDSNIIQQQNSLQKINDFEDILQNEFAQKAIVDRALQDQKNLFDTLDNQMSTLNIYFESFNSSLKTLESNFQILANLPECSTL